MRSLSFSDCSRKGNPPKKIKPQILIFWNCVEQMQCCHTGKLYGGLSHGAAFKLLTMLKVVSAVGPYPLPFSVEEE
jgi:hypothetical protein